jgi:hypothetical protein
MIMRAIQDDALNANPEGQAGNLPPATASRIHRPIAEDGVVTVIVQMENASTIKMLIPCNDT